MSNCHCGSGNSYQDCCEPIISGAKPAETPEQLMRARYSAYCVENIDFIGESLHPNHRQDWDRLATARWAAESEWLGLQVLGADGGGPGEDSGHVQFAARFRERGQNHTHQENSLFERHNGRWYYVSGETPKAETVRHEQPKVGRNDPCPCGSGKKYKKCCGA